MLWVIVYRPEQCARWSLWFAPSLLPITKRPYRYINAFGKRYLRKACCLSNLFYLNGIDMEFTRWLTLAAIDLVHLSHAFYKTIKEIFFHHFHPLLRALAVTCTLHHPNDS